METRSKILLGIAVAAIAFVIFHKEDVWTGYYYPDADNLYVSVPSPELKSLDECRNWVDDQIVEPSSNWDYECGLNCEYKSDIGLSVCEETVK